MTRLIHIGLGKCGSTFLQQAIFPKISKKLNISFLNQTRNNFLKNINIDNLENSQKIYKFLPDKFIISDETLFSKNWEFIETNKSFENLKNNFSNDTIILIVIRNPYDLLNSIYCQAIQKMNLVYPEDFFYVNSKNINSEEGYNLYNFDYNNLINLYRSFFNKVVVVKYEEIKNFEFFKDIFDLDDNFIKELKKDCEIHYNRSISKYGIFFLLYLNKFFDLKKYDTSLKKYIKKSNNYFYKIINKIFIAISARFFFQKFFDKFFYKKFYLKKEYIPINIDNEIIKYNELKF